MGDMDLKIYHNIFCIYCDNDINDDRSYASTERQKTSGFWSIVFPISTKNSLGVVSMHAMQCLFYSYWNPEGALELKPHMCITEVIELMTYDPATAVVD